MNTVMAKMNKTKSNNITKFLPSGFEGKDYCIQCCIWLQRHGRCARLERRDRLLQRRLRVIGGAGEEGQGDSLSAAARNLGRPR